MPSPKLPFLAQASMLEQIIRQPPSNVGNAALMVINAIKEHKELRRHFFQHRPHPEWYKLVLNDPIARVPSDDQESIFVGMQYYLLGIAPDAPDLVLEHVRELDDRIGSRALAVQMLARISVEQSVTATPIVLRWLSSEDPQEGLPEACLQWAINLASSSHSQALELLAGALRPVARPGVRGEPSSPFQSEFQRDELVQELFTTLRESSQARLLDVLELVLCGSVDLIRTSDDRVAARRWSSWRSAIEDSGQDRNDSYLDFLIVQLRNESTRLLSVDPRAGREYTERLLASEYSILQRLGIHLVRLYDRILPDKVEAVLLDQSQLASTPNHHEVFMLLRDGFPKLHEPLQHALASNILNGPPQNLVERLVAFSGHQVASEAGEGYARAFRNGWIRDRLWMIRDHLAPDAKRKLDALVADHGAPDHPEFLSFVGTVSYLSDATPTDVDSLAAMDVPSLLALARSWRPSGANGLPAYMFSRQGFGEQVAELLALKPDLYMSHLVALLSNDPQYVSGCFNRLAKGVPSPDTTWPFLLNAAEMALNSASSVDSEAWEQARLSAAWLLQAGARDDSARCPSHLFDSLEALLVKMVGDPSPSPRELEHWKAEASTLSLNAVRPIAYRALVDLAMRRATAEDKASASQGPGPSRLTGVAREALASGLSLETEPTASTRYVFGEKFNQLLWLDQSWLEDRLDSMIPTATDPWYEEAFDAWWLGYLSSAQQWAPAWNLARRRLPALLRRLRAGLSIDHYSASNLSSLLLGDFLRASEVGTEVPGQHLLFDFYAAAPPAVRGAAGWVLTRSVRELDTGASWGRLKAIWRWRLHEVSKAGFVAEDDDEMSHLVDVFELAPKSETMASLWPIVELAVGHTAGLGRGGQSWRALERYAASRSKREPGSAIALYGLMWAGRKSPKPYVDPVPAEEIIGAAVQGGFLREALEVLDVMARHGVSWAPNLHKRYR